MMIRPPSRPLWSQTGLVALAALVTLTGLGCPDKHIGRPCDVTTMPGDDKMPGTNFAYNTLALECPSRICILPNQQVNTDTRALCTDECSNDDDCADGEIRNKSDTNDKRCQEGFACRTALPPLDGVSLSCKKLCVCKDFLKDKKTDVKPLGCN